MEILMNRNFLFILILTCTCYGNIYAGGTEFKPFTSSKTVSLNGLYFAGSDGIVKSFSNPAGLTYLNESGIEFSLLDCLAQNSFDNSERKLFNSLKEDEFSFSGGFIWSVSEELKAALTYQQVVGYKVSWPYANYYRQDSLNALLVFDFYNDLAVNAITASLSYRFDNFSIGLSPILYHVSHKIAFPQNNNLWTAGIGTAAYQFEYDQEAWTFGFSFGLITELASDLKVGISVRSMYSADLEGNAKSRMFAVTDSTDELTSVKSVFEMPWIFGIGTVYSLSSNINLNFDIQYSLWESTQSSMTQSFGNSIWQNKLSNTDFGSGINGSNFNLSYRNTFDLGVGFEYISENSFSYRVGYCFSQSPNSDRTYNMLYPSVDQHVFSIGAGMQDGNFLVDATLLYSFGIERSVKNEIVPILDGKYNYEIIVPMITLKYILF